MWNGKNKAVTFSFDDGVTQDIRLIEILNKYGLKGTFNLNSSLLGLQGELSFNNHVVRHDKIPACKVKEIYAGHEVAVHTLTHPNLTGLDEETIVYQVEEDRKQLSRLCGYEVVGMAYPCGGVNNDDRVAGIIRTRTGVKYSRTITSTEDFNLQSNYFRFNPSVYYAQDNFEQIVDEFLATQSSEPQLLYIWGHAYEMDGGLISWEKFEKICQKISGKADIFYGTNKEVLL
ncbi:MAG: polysaccharide deacetylase family protein [Clostridia bacterium]|nr:polysaccharide deacetylase family protein [Clostridia bacterium]